jgi:outer membrane protein OmpA-like peptidoglycan-associated protein
MRVFLTILLSLSLTAAFGQHATDTFHLYFDLNVPALSKGSEEKIDVLIYNDKIISGASVMIIGYTDYLGSEGYNKNLSMQRAENVKKYLVKYGLNADDIKLCEGKGQVSRDVTRSKDGYPHDRRVDIVVNNKVKKPLPPKPEKKQPAVVKKTNEQKVNIGSMDEVKNLKPGSTFLLKNMYFPAGRHIITPESEATLEKLYEVLKENPNIKISIEGHVCCIQEDEPDALDVDTYELKLSVNRAKAIYGYLVSKGIDASRLSYVGFGKRKPVVAEELNEEDAERNRRVEIRVVDNK